MAGHRRPGPEGRGGQTDDVRDGTLIRQASPLPGSLCHAGPQGRRPRRSALAMPVSAPRTLTPSRRLPVLRASSRGHHVENLQRLLNTRLDPSPRLDIDGLFGPLTRQAVLAFQKGAAIAVDGVVGNVTWYHLLKGGVVRAPGAAGAEATPGPSQPAAPAADTSSPPPALAASGVLGMSLEDRFKEVLKRTPGHLGPELADQFRGLLTPLQLGIMGGSLVALAVSHAFGVGEAVDLVLMGVGVIFLGKAAIDVARDFGDFLSLTATAESEEDLDKAAANLARVVAVVGVTVLTSWLMKKVGGKLRGKGPKGSGEPGGSESSTSPKSEPAKPKSAPEPEPEPAQKAAPKSKFPANESQTKHIFRNAEGHIPDTPENRALLQSVADDPANSLGSDRFGNSWSAKTNPDGTQTWVQTRNGTIINGGVNQTPRTYNPSTGLSGKGGD